MRKWRGVLIIEGVQTGDGRFFTEGSIQWRDLPLALVDDHPTFASNNNAIGNVQTIERVGNEIRATGVIDDETDAGAERVRMMDAGTAPMGNRFPVSIEFHDAEVEIIDTTIEESDESATDSEIDDLAIIASGKAALVIAKAKELARRVVRAAAGDGEPEGVILFAASQDDIVERYTNARIHNVATVTAGAIDGAYIELDGTAEESTDEPADEPVEESLTEAIINADVVDLTAAATKSKPPRDWLYAPEPEEGDPRLVAQYDIETGAYIGDAMPLHIGDDGFVCGHLAPKDRCHIGYAGMCVTPPESMAAYSHFHVGCTICDDGSEIPTGHLTVNVDHADTIGLDLATARDWYANKGFAWANVRVTPGKFGPWVCGAVLPGVSEELVVALRGGGISGDWRGANGNLELVAILAVNTPGFTIQRGMAAGGQPVRITAARSFVQIANDAVHLVTRPVVRATTADLTASAAPCGCKTGMTRQERMLAELWAEVVAPKKKAALAARFGR